MAGGAEHSPISRAAHPSFNIDLSYAEISISMRLRGVNFKRSVVLRFLWEPQELTEIHELRKCVFSQCGLMSLLSRHYHQLVGLNQAWVIAGVQLDVRNKSASDRSIPVRVGRPEPGIVRFPDAP